VRHSNFAVKSSGKRQLFHQLSPMQKKYAIARGYSTAGFLSDKKPVKTFACQFLINASLYRGSGNLRAWEGL
jgi:hypothetical protein